LLQSPSGEVIGNKAKLIGENLSEGELVFSDGKTKVRIIA